MVALVSLSAILITACDPVSHTASTLRDVGEDAATLIAPQPSPTHRSSPNPAEVPPYLAEVFAGLEALEVAPRGSGVEYRRRDWRHWIDADRDCQNTRAEVLIEESQGQVSFATDERCRVVTGRWEGPWSGELFVNSSDVDIDHHVPLGHAHDSGGWRWNDDRKRAYANDLSNAFSLQVTSASVNRSKGKQAPDEWKPDQVDVWCRYAVDWISVKQQWSLTVTEAEVRALTDMLGTCAGGDP